MADPVGRLEKTTNAVYAWGVVGRRCVWASAPEPPGAPSPPPPPPGTPTPPNQGGAPVPAPSPSCPPRRLVVWFDKGVKYGMLVPAALGSPVGGVGMPSGCPGASAPFRL